MAALQKEKKKERKEKKPWVERGGGGWEKEKAATAVNIAGCMNCPCVRSLGDTPASERAPRMALAHWLSAEGLEKSGSGNKTSNLSQHSPTQESWSLGTSGSGRGDTQRPGSRWGCPRECHSPCMTVLLFHPVRLILVGGYNPVFLKSLLKTVFESDLWPANTTVGKSLGKKCLQEIGIQFKATLKVTRTCKASSKELKKKKKLDKRAQGEMTLPVTPAQ